MITRRAPGKLLIAGEYAVVRPGHPAVVVAVDRFVTVTVSDTAAESTMTSDSNGGTRIRCGRTGDRLVPAGDRETISFFSYALAAVRVVEQLVVESGRPPRHFDMRIAGRDLSDADGRKFGLGSSGATTVAIVDALGAFYGLRLEAMDIFRLAMLATLTVNPRASGADLAAAVWGGWLEYRSPERARLAIAPGERDVTAKLRAAWPGLSVRPLPAPKQLRLLIGWTGEPQATTALVARIDDEQWDTPLFAGFLADSDLCVTGLIDAIEADDVIKIQHRIGRARRILEGLDSAAHVGIRTPVLDALCAAADLVGAAAKPSGAGGGDCGIAILGRDSDRQATELTRRWLAADIRPLALNIQSIERDTP
ncbi:phosphomevalonate kinase [Nocardia sp. alder85J]|uniref:phosphomevalonate kinase n=1 Tax=Nocardia sp. alder85J TaxID=2862949 RepID=UPI001CD1CC78|nr:phosphomevalonate kinase [Nocardia sp. alder85J]MCX4095783.1 phosphomevalonate kinase [Nocardia sp. alder85J]